MHRRRGIRLLVLVAVLVLGAGVLVIGQWSRFDPDSAAEAARHDALADQTAVTISSQIAAEATTEVLYLNTLLSPGTATVTVRRAGEISADDAQKLGDLAACGVYTSGLDPISSLDVYVYGSFPNSFGTSSDRLVVDRSYTNTFATDLFGSALDLDDLAAKCAPGGSQ